jgi:hypothetical protein
MKRVGTNGITHLTTILAFILNSYHSQAKKSLIFSMRERSLLKEIKQGGICLLCLGG